MTPTMTPTSRKNPSTDPITGRIYGASDLPLSFLACLSVFVSSVVVFIVVSVEIPFVDFLVGFVFSEKGRSITSQQRKILHIG